MHVVPRWKGDTNFMPVVGDTRVMPEALPDTWRKLRDGFSRRPADDGGRPRHLQGLRRARHSIRTRSTMTSPTASARGVRARARRPARAATRPAGAARGGRPRHAAPLPRARRGLHARARRRGCHVLDIGMVGTEMVYYAVGSRELDGGVSVTASHNPKQWAGFKLVREGALRCRVTRASRTCSGSRRPRTSRARRGRARSSRPTSTSAFRSTCSASSTREVIRPMQVVLDGGNGMAGPMIGPILDPSRSRASGSTSSPTVSSPATSRTRCCEENRKLIIDTVLAATPSSASPGTATPTAASSSTTRASSCRATS